MTSRKKWDFYTPLLSKNFVTYGSVTQHQAPCPLKIERHLWTSPYFLKPFKESDFDIWFEIRLRKVLNFLRIIKSPKHLNLLNQKKYLNVFWSSNKSEIFKSFTHKNFLLKKGEKLQKGHDVHLQIFKLVWNKNKRISIKTFSILTFLYSSTSTSFMSCQSLLNTKGTIVE